MHGAAIKTVQFGSYQGFEELFISFFSVEVRSSSFFFKLSYLTTAITNRTTYNAVLRPQKEVSWTCIHPSSC